MKRKLIVLTDELAKELETYPNQSEIVRKALEVYIEHISPEVIAGLRQAYKRIDTRMANIEQNMDTIANAASTHLDRHTDWGA